MMFNEIRIKSNITTFETLSEGEKCLPFGRSVEAVKRVTQLRMKWQGREVIHSMP